MTRGARVRRGVVVLSMVVAAAAGCSGGRPATERVSHAAGARRLPGRRLVHRRPQPGQLGPAVIAGHVDSQSGPAVFYRLRELRPGDEIRVVRADHRVVRFRVDSLASHPKQALPDDAVYGATTTPALRLICAGTFDRTKHSYRDNLVVSATRIADGPGAGANR